MTAKFKKFMFQCPIIWWLTTINRIYFIHDLCYVVFCIVVIFKGDSVVLVWWSCRWWWEWTEWRFLVISWVFIFIWGFRFLCVIEWGWWISYMRWYACCGWLTVVKFSRWSWVTVRLLTSVIVISVFFIIRIIIFPFCWPSSYISNFDSMLILTSLSLGNILLEPHPFHTLPFCMIWNTLAVVSERSWHLPFSF